MALMMNVWPVMQAGATLFAGLVLAAEQEATAVSLAIPIPGGATGEHAHFCTPSCPYDFTTAVPPNGTLSCSDRGLEPLMLTCSSAAMSNISSAAQITALGGGVSCSLTGANAFRAILVVSMAFLMISASQGPKRALLQARAACWKLREVIERTPPIDSFSSEGKSLEQPRGAIELRDVTFAYPSLPDFNVCRGYS